MREDVPVFYSKCDMDGQSTTLEAGNNDYFMNASYFADSTNKLFVFKGDLRKTTCTNCGYALTILFNDYKFSAPSWKMNVDSALFIGEHYYNDRSIKTEFYKSDFTPAHNSAGTYTWTFFDGKTTSTLEEFSGSKLLNANKTYTVTLKYDNGQGTCFTSHENVFKIGNPLQTTVSAVRQTPLYESHYQFSAQATGQAPYQYLWDFNDQTTPSTESAPTHSFAFKSGDYKVKLRIIDSKNDTCFSYYQINGSPEQSCTANFNMAFKPIDNPKLFGSVTVLLTDANGIEYSSKELVQNPNDKFFIESLKDYSLRNKNGEPTKSVKVNFNCVVKNGATEIKLSNGSAIFAVSYK